MNTKHAGWLSVRLAVTILVTGPIAPVAWAQTSEQAAQSQETGLYVLFSSRGGRREPGAFVDRLRLVDPDRGRPRRHLGRPADEPLGVGGVGGGQDGGAASTNGLSLAVVHHRRREQGKNRWQNVSASSEAPNRSGKSGRYLRVLHCAPEKGLASETWGREGAGTTPRAARSSATGWEVLRAIGDHQEEFDTTLRALGGAG